MISGRNKHHNFLHQDRRRIINFDKYIKVTSCGPGGVQVGQFSSSKGRSAIDLWKHNVSLQILVGSFHFGCKILAYKKCNCSVHPFLWETIGRNSLAKSKTISFLDFSTSPGNTFPNPIICGSKTPWQHQLPLVCHCQKTTP